MEIKFWVIEDGEYDLVNDYVVDESGTTWLVYGDSQLDTADGIIEAHFYLNGERVA